jgi:DNA-binding transcriptional regulator YiaG
MTQTEFAEVLGIYRQQTISDWECGAHGRILPAYQRLLDVLERQGTI